MTADVDDIVDAAHDPKVTVLVAPGAVAGKIDIFNLRPVLFPVSFVVAPDRAQHRGPGTLDYQIAAFVRAHRFAVARHHVDFNSREGLSRSAGFGWSGAGQRRDHDCAGLRLPPRVDNRTDAAPDDPVIPHPRFRIDWLADGAQQAQARKVVLQRPLLAPLNERADGRRRRVENVDAMSFDEVPKAIRLGMGLDG